MTTKNIIWLHVCSDCGIQRKNTQQQRKVKLKNSTNLHSKIKSLRIFKFKPAVKYCVLIQFSLVTSQDECKLMQATMSHVDTRCCSQPILSLACVIDDLIMSGDALLHASTTTASSSSSRGGGTTIDSDGISIRWTTGSLGPPQKFGQTGPCLR